MNYGPYRGPVRVQTVATKLGGAPDGVILTADAHVGTWWACGCQVRGEEPFAVVCGCDEHETLWAALKEAPLLQGYAGGRYVFGAEGAHAAPETVFADGQAVVIMSGPHADRVGTIADVRQNPDVGRTYLVNFRDARGRERNIEFMPGMLRAARSAS